MARTPKGRTPPPAPRRGRNSIRSAALSPPSKARRQGYRHGEVHGDRGIGRVAAIGQDVAADQRRARLVGGDQTREAFDRPDLKRLVVAEPAGRQHERADRQDREPCPGHPLGHPLKYHHPMVTLKWKGLGTIPCA
jgi:hypothetical protein